MAGPWEQLKALAQWASATVPGGSLGLRSRVLNPGLPGFGEVSVQALQIPITNHSGLSARLVVVSDRSYALL